MIGRQEEGARMEDRTNEGADPPASWSLVDWNDLPSTTSAPSRPPPAPATPPPSLEPWGFGGNGGTSRRSRPWSKIAVAVGTVLALLVGGFIYLSLNRSSGGTALAFSLSPGNNLRYGLHMNMSGKLSLQGQSVPFTMAVDETFSWKVDSVDAQGVATVEMRLEDMSGKVDGVSIPNGGKFQTTLRIARDGRILAPGALTPAGGNSFSQLPGMDQFTPLLPVHPVKPGDTWTKTFSQPFPLGSGSLNYSTNNTFVRYEVVNGVRAAVINTQLTTPLNITMDFRKLLALSGQARLLPKGTNPTITYSGNVSMNQTAWFDPRMGEMIKQSGQGHFDLSMRFRGFPATMGQPQGQIGFSGTMSLAIEQK
jgi:hypothetical protein